MLAVQYRQYHRPEHAAGNELSARNQCTPRHREFSPSLISLHLHHLSPCCTIPHTSTSPPHVITPHHCYLANVLKLPLETLLVGLWELRHAHSARPMILIMMMSVSTSLTITPRFLGFPYCHSHTPEINSFCVCVEYVVCPACTR